MGARKFVGRGAGVGVGAIVGFGVGIGFSGGLHVGVGSGAGIGLGIGYGYMAGIGAEYINVAPDFAEKKTHKQNNPFKALENQMRKVFKRPVPAGGHPVQEAS